MANAKKILITTESHELFILRRSSRVVSQHSCPFCSNVGCGLTLDDAQVFAGVPALELIREIDKAAVHAYEAAGGPLLICKKSLEIFRNGEK